MAYVLLVIGFILLIKGADWFVDGSCSFAKIKNNMTCQEELISVVLYIIYTIYLFIQIVIDLTIV